MMKGKKPLVKSLIKPHGETIKTSFDCIISDYNVQGMTIKQKLYDDDTAERYIHLYFSPEIYNENYSKLMNSVNEYKTILQQKLGSKYTPLEEIQKYFKCNFGKDGKLVSFELNKDFIPEEMSQLGFF